MKKWPRVTVSLLFEIWLQLWINEMKILFLVELKTTVLEFLDFTDVK